MTTATGSAGFEPQERPASPGAPYMPSLSLSRRVGFAVNGVLIALLANLGTNLYASNLSVLAGGYGVTTAEAVWLSVVSTGVASTAFLYMVKARQQFGIDRVIRWQLWLHVAASILLLIHPTFTQALVARATNGMVSATTTALAVYHLLEALPSAKRAVALPVTIGCVQINSALAHLFPIDVLTDAHNRGLHLICLAIPLMLLALLIGNPLPPTLRAKAFEWRDLLSTMLFLPAIMLLVALLGLGRTYWWQETQWLGWAAAAAIALFAVGFLYEWRREHPLMSLAWLDRHEIIAFIAVILIERVAVAEQSSAAIGLLSSSGLNNDQFHGLFLVVIAAEILGIAIVALTLGPASIGRLVTVAFLLIAGAAWIDSGSNGLTRPHDMLLSQAMIGLGITLFIGPALVWIVSRVLKTGSQYLVTMILMFSFCQYVGSIGSSALVGSYQYVRSARHDMVLAERVRVQDVPVQQRIAQTAAAATALTPDERLRSDIGVAALDRSASEQANILGYIDAFRTIVAVAVLGALCLMGWRAFFAYKQRDDAA